MLIKILIIVMLIAMLVSLFAALYFMFKDKSSETRMVKALTWRVGIWAVLLALLFLGVYTGVIKPSNTIPLPPKQSATQ